MRIVTMEPLGVPTEKIQALAEKLKKSGHLFTYHETKETDEVKLIERLKDADIVILANQPLSRIVIESCPNLKMLSVAFTGVDHIALDACKERNITVCNAAGYSTHAVAELAFGLAIAVIRNIVPCDKATRAEKTKDGLVGFELHGKKFGVIGTGAIGTKVAEIARAFGCEVLACSRTKKAELTEKGIAYVDLPTLLTACDFVSLHVPLNAHTQNLINAQSLSSMKPSAILINTARGPVVDNTALAAALNEDRIAGAGIDVFEMEPPVPCAHPLVGAKNVVLTPHVAFATKEALLTRAQIVFDNIEQWQNGTPKNLI